MKKAIKIILVILLLVVLIITLMWTFKICPPQGPWMSPPWCANKSFTRRSFDIKTEAKHLDKGLRNS